MKAKRLLTLVVAAVLLTAATGCGLTDSNQTAAQLRLQKIMTEARLSTAEEYLADGYNDQAVEVLEPYMESENTATRAIEIYQRARALRNEFAKARGDHEVTENIY